MLGDKSNEATGYNSQSLLREGSLKIFQNQDIQSTHRALFHMSPKMYDGAVQ